MDYQMSAEGSVTDEEHVKRIFVYNANSKLKYVKLFTDDNQPHCSRVMHRDDDFEFISLIRIYFYSNSSVLPKSILYPHKMFGRQTNLSRFFSVYQFQQTIIDIPCTGRLKDLQWEIPLHFMEYCLVVIYAGSEPIQSIHLKNEFYISVKNTSYDQDIEVDLMDLRKGENIPKDIKVKFHDLQQNGDKFSLLRVFSSTKQMPEKIELIYKGMTTLIEPIKHFSANQFQGGCIDIPIDKLDIHSLPNESIPYIPLKLNIKTTIKSGEEVFYNLL